MLRNPLEKVFQDLLTKYATDQDGREILTAAAALAGNTARQAVYQKDYVVKMFLDPADPAQAAGEGLIVTDQGYQFFATSIFAQWDNPAARPEIYVRDDGAETNFSGGPRGTALQPYQSAANFGPAAAQVLQGVNVYRVYNEPKDFTWMAGDRAYLVVRGIARAAAANLAVIVTGFQINLATLERGDR